MAHTTSGKPLWMSGLALFVLASTAACGSDPQIDETSVMLSGSAQGLLSGSDATWLVAARWSTEGPTPGVLVQAEPVSAARAAVPFELDVIAPDAAALDYESDGDYYYSSAELVLLDDASLDTDWVNAGALNEAEVGRAPYIILYVDRDMPEDAEGHFGIGPVEAGFHLLQRMPDREVTDASGRVTGAIAVWAEIALDTPIAIELGADGSYVPAA